VDNVLKRISSYGMKSSDWIQVMQAMSQLRQVVKVGIHFHDHIKYGEFLDYWRDCNKLQAFFMK